MLPNKIIGEQEAWRNAQEKAKVSESIEKKTYIHFQAANSHFLLSIDEVKEVSEVPPIQAYPQKVENHFGIVNLRGNIIPIISVVCFIKDKVQIKEKEDLHVLLNTGRLIAINDSRGDCFGIIASSLKKVTLPQSQLNQPIISLDDIPARIISSKDLFLEK